MQPMPYRRTHSLGQKMTRMMLCILGKPVFHIVYMMHCS